MAHEIGQMFYYGEVPWHGLGNKLDQPATVDEALSALTGIDAGTRDALGRYPAGSLNARVEARLADLAERSRAPAPARPKVAERRGGRRS